MCNNMAVCLTFVTNVGYTYLLGRSVRIGLLGISPTYSSREFCFRMFLVPCQIN